MAEQTKQFPTEIIELPSRGLVYPEGHPLRAGTCELKRMTAREEDILASQSLIKKGMVLDKLFESVVVQPGLDVNDVFIGDKNAILLATRVLAYGPDYEIQMTDPFSGEPQTVIVDLSKVQTKDIEYDKLNEKNVYKFTLPKSDKVIEFKLLTHKDEIDIAKDTQALNRISKNKETSADVTTRFRYMILSVDGNTDRAFINNWIPNQFESKDTKAFRNYVKEISPDLDLKFTFISDITGESEALDIPFGINFFYPTN